MYEKILYLSQGTYYNVVMCFSEEVSFTAAGVLAIIAVGSFYAARNSKERYALAAVPLFFALQQAAEGVQWLVYKGNWGTLAEAHSARDLYLFIAYALWPFWIPFSLWVAEKQPTRRFWLQIFLFAGLALALYEGWKMFFYPVDSYIKENSIYYYVEVNKPFLWPYLIITIGSWFISSLRYTNLMGLVLFFGSLLAAYLYYFTFISVWCFLAAIVSVIVFFIVNSEDTAKD